jgi:hypothetical protein
MPKASEPGPDASDTLPDYYETLADLRKHADACHAETEAFRRRADGLADAEPTLVMAAMKAWDLRLRTWLALFDAYMPAAEAHAERGHPGMLSYLLLLMDWVSGFRPDAEDRGLHGG